MIYWGECFSLINFYSLHCCGVISDFNKTFNEVIFHRAFGVTASCKDRIQIVDGVIGRRWIGIRAVIFRG